MNAHTRPAQLSIGSAAKRLAGRRNGRRKTQPFLAAFEAVACELVGRKTLGRLYRQGRQGLSSPRFRFAPFELNGDVERAPRREERGRMVQQRLEALLTLREIDLLYLRFVAEWSQSEVARERGVHRSTIKRQEERIFAVLRVDPLLRWLVRLPPFPPEAAVQHGVHLYEGHSIPGPHAAGRNGVRRGILLPASERRRNAA